MAMFRTLQEQAQVQVNLCLESLPSYSYHILIYRIKVIANCILRHLATENTVINYLSRHFEHRKMPLPCRC